MTKRVVVLSIWYVDEVNPPDQAGWYHIFSLDPDYLENCTMEVGPFPTEQEAREDAARVALSVPQWDVRDAWPNEGDG